MISRIGSLSTASISSSARSLAYGCQLLLQVVLAEKLQEQKLRGIVAKDVLLITLSCLLLLLLLLLGHQLDQGILLKHILVSTAQASL